MRVRKVDASGDMRFGRNQADYHRDSPDGVAQVVESRLNLWEGQFYLDLEEGTPYETQVLGRRTEALRDPALRTRILQTPGVARIEAYASALDRATRRLTVQATIATIYSRGGAGASATQAPVLTSVRVDR